MSLGEVERTGALGLAVVGAGRWGKNLIRVCRELHRAELLSVCDLDARKLAALPPGLPCTSDYRAVLDDPRTNAVVLATPPGTHAALTLAALEAGKHVFVEKPMAVSLGEATQVLAASERYQRRVMVGLILRYHPLLSVLRSWLTDGLLGEVRAAYTERRGSIRGCREHGPWWSLAPHDVAALRFLLGDEPTRVAAVDSHADGVAHVSASLEFPGQRVATVRVGDDTNTKVRRIMLVGTSAAALFDDAEPVHKLRRIPNGDGERPLTALLADFADGSWVSPIEHPLPTSKEPLTLELEHFVSGVLDAVPFYTDVVEGVRVVAALAAGEASLRAGGVPVRVNRVGRAFPGVSRHIVPVAGGSADVPTGP